MKRAALFLIALCLGGGLTYAWALASEWQALPAEGRAVVWLRV